MKENRKISIKEIKKIVLEAGYLLYKARNDKLTILQKTSLKDLLTQYDILMQKNIIQGIREYDDNALIISEEMSDIGSLSDDDTFIIDPIDGTTNLVHGIRYSAISVAWFRNREPFYGIVYNPFDNELYEAEKGRGAFLNGERIHVSGAPLKDSVVAFGTSPYNPETTDFTFKKARELYEMCHDVRRMGSAALDICQVAAGKVGLFFEASLSAWDYAAAQLILSEAGGKLVNFYGENIKFTSEKTSVIAGSSKIISESKLVQERKTKSRSEYYITTTHDV